MDYNEKYINIVKNKILELTRGIDCDIFLFGSRARGDFDRASDIDLGFDSMERDDFLRIQRRFSQFWEDSIVPWQVDLVYFPDVKESFKIVAQKDKVIWKTS